MLDMNKLLFIILILSVLPSSVLSAPPTFAGLPDSISLVESAVGDITTSLYQLTVSDPDGDLFNCEVPPASGFVVLDIGAGDQVFLASNPGLVGSTTVILTVTCTDANNEPSTADLSVNILENSPPQISGLPATRTVKQGENTNFDVFAFTVTDSESDSYSCKIDSMTPAGGPFSYQNSPSKKVVLNAGHSLDPGVVASYSIVIKCEDSYGFSTGTLTVLVTGNSQPQFSGLPTSVSVPEKDAGGRSIYTVTVSDPESDNFVCTITTVPAVSPFYIDQPSTQYEIMIPSSPALSPPNYDVTITCTDPYGSSSDTLTVNVVPNSAPTITGLPHTATISESDPAGTDVYSMTVSDSEGDSFNCQIGSVSPMPSPFVMVPPGTQYKVQLASNHNLQATTTPSYDVTLECTDYSTSSGVLTVVVQKNTPPAITIAPTGTVTVAAGETASRTLYTLTVTDTDPFTCSMTSSPAGPFSLVYETSNYVIKLNNNPSFSVTSYTLSVTCPDPYGSTTETRQITVSANQAPVISNLPSTVTILETETAAQCLQTLAVTDPESETITCSLVSDPSGPFVIQEDQGIPEYKVCLLANAITTLDGQTNPSHSITVNCSDTSNGMDSKVMTVQVTVNNAPVITSLPDIVDVSENEKAERKIWDLTVSDPENDLFVCHLTTVPPNGPFDCRKNSTNFVYTTFLLSTPNLDASLVPQYVLTFTCTDSPKGRSSSKNLTVNVVENRAPTFVNLAGDATPNAMATLIHNVIFDVDGQDDDVQDTLLYSMTISPHTNSFSINTVTGEISATRDLKYELTSVYVANVTVTDTKKSTSALLNIKLQNVNTAPVISNMVLNDAKNVYFSEFTTAGTILSQITIDDPDVGQTHTITRYVYPTDQVGMFDVNTNQVDLATGKSFDYEDIQYYRLALYVSDSFAQTGPYYLVVNILNEPEVCDFPKNVYQFNTYEGGKGGGNIHLNLTSIILDKDKPADTHTYSLIPTAYSKLFNIDTSTGIVTFAVDYDIDRTHPQNLTILLKCTDKFGLTGTATVSLYIGDVNDNEPDFTQQGYVCIVTQYTKKGTHICTITANDIDQEENGEVEYSGSSPTGVGFAAVTANGRVYATKDIHSNSFDHIRFDVKAVDHGKPQLTGKSYVDIFYRETSTFSTTTLSYDDDWWSQPENIIMVVALAILGLLLLALLFYLCYKYGPNGCSKGIKNPFKNLKCCNRKKSMNVKSPKNPKPEKFKLWDANDLNKTREPYKTGQVESTVPEAMKL